MGTVTTPGEVPARRRRRGLEATELRRGRAALDRATRLGVIRLPACVLPHDGVVAFIVRGDCMSGDRIGDGDVVVVDPDRAPRHGDIGVFSVGGQLVLQRLDLSDGIRLVPSNPAAHGPIVPGSEDGVAAVGTVIGSVRSLDDGTLVTGGRDTP